MNNMNNDKFQFIILFFYLVLILFLLTNKEVKINNIKEKPNKLDIIIVELQEIKHILKL